MTIQRIATLLERCGTPERNFPATELYNPEWLLRLVLDWFSAHPGIDHDLAFTETDRWYAQGLLPSAFSPRYQADILAEPRAEAGAVIGDVIPGADQNADLSLADKAGRILVIEAELFGRLAPGVRNTHYFNQAARTVACIAELVRRSQIPPPSFDAIGFFLLAPATQIHEGHFAQYMSPGRILDIVKRRVAEYQDPEKDRWLAGWFMPTLENIRVREIAWEEIINLISERDPSFGEQMETFYKKCLEYNLVKAPSGT